MGGRAARGARRAGPVAGGAGAARRRRPVSSPRRCAPPLRCRLSTARRWTGTRWARWPGRGGWSAGSWPGREIPAASPPARPSRWRPGRRCRPGPSRCCWPSSRPWPATDWPRRGRRRAGRTYGGSARTSRSGWTCCPPARSLTPTVVGLAAAGGLDAVPVRPRPGVAGLLTGDELVHAGGSGGGRVRDAVGPALPGWVRGARRRAAAGPRGAGHRRDDTGRRGGRGRR